MAADIEAMERVLDSEPGNWEQRLVLADAYEEAGDEAMAFAQRWMAAKRRKPFKGASLFGEVMGEATWEWWSKPGMEAVKESTIWEPVIYQRLTQYKFKAGNDQYREWKTRSDAEKALAKALKECREAGEI
jgi:hypothetical protein